MMKVLMSSSITIDINGTQMVVPDVNYVTIDFQGTVKGWYSRPELYDGKWCNSSYSIHIGTVELDPTDTWTRVFDVQINKFVDEYSRLY